MNGERDEVHKNSPTGKHFIIIRLTPFPEQVVNEWMPITVRPREGVDENAISRTIFVDTFKEKTEHDRDSSQFSIALQISAKSDGHCPTASTKLVFSTVAMFPDSAIALYCP